EESERKEEWKAPTPRREILGGDEETAGEHDGNAQDEPADHAGLNIAGIIAAPLRRGMLGDVDCSAAILAAKGQALKDAQKDDDEGRCETDRLRRGNKPY